MGIGVNYDVRGQSMMDAAERRMQQIQQKTSRTIYSRRLGKVGTLGATIAISGLLGGCISYTNVPEPESAPAFKSANHNQAIKVTREALDDVIERYPMRDAQGRYSVNLPAGTNLESAQLIINGLPDGAVLPSENMDDSIPVYHIGRIWIRASDAKVDVLYPARSFDGSEFTGNVTVWLNGGVRSWRLNRMQHWAPGTIPVPPIYVPISEEEMNAPATIEEEVQVESQPAPETTPEPVVEQPESLPEPQPESNALYREVTDD